MEKLNDFVDLFVNNVFVEYNKNTLLKSHLIPISKYYETICTGDRLFLKYLDRLKYFNNSQSSIPQYYGGITIPKTTSKVQGLPCLYSFSLKKYLYGLYFKIKNLFYNKQTALKFTVEDELIPNLLNKDYYTEDGMKDLEIFLQENCNKSLRDLRNIEYLGKNEFLMEGECNGFLQIKIRVKEDDNGIKIDELKFNGLS